MPLVWVVIGCLPSHWYSAFGSWIGFFSDSWYFKSQGWLIFRGLATTTSHEAALVSDWTRDSSLSEQSIKKGNSGWILLPVFYLTDLTPVEQILKNFRSCFKVLEYGIHYQTTSKMPRLLVYSSVWSNHF